MNDSAHITETQRGDAPRITVMLDRPTLTHLDELVERAGNCSRSALVRLAIREMFQRLTAGESGKGF